MIRLLNPNHKGEIYSKVGLESAAPTGFKRIHVNSLDVEDMVF